MNHVLLMSRVFCNVIRGIDLSLLALLNGESDLRHVVKTIRWTIDLQSYHSRAIFMI